MRTRGHRHRAYEHLRTRILRLALPPGVTISENELAAELGMSRTPVREAIMLLTDEGLVEVLPQVGTFVSRVDPDRVAEAQFLREAVELASLQTLGYPLGDLSALEENLAAQDAADDDIDRFFALDEDFHRGLMALAGHEASWATVAAAKGHLDRARRLGIEQPGSTARFAAEHRAVFDAIIIGDLDRATELLRRHLRVVFDDILTLQRESPELFVTDPDARPVRRSVLVWE